MKLSVLLALVAIALSGCGGGGTSNGGGGGGGQLTEAQRNVAANAALAAFLDMAGKTTAEKAAALPGRWKAISGFADAGYNAATDTFWGTFTDGVPYMYMNGTKPVPPLRPDVAPKAMDQLPVPKKVALFDTLGTAFGHPMTRIKTALQKHGYTATVGIGFIEELAQVSGVAGILWQTHGGMGYQAKGFPVQKVLVYGLWTENAMTATPTAQIAGMIANGELGVCAATVDTDFNPTDDNHNGTIDDDERLTHENHYMILQKFVDLHMSTGENSFVWIDACSSVTDAGLVATFLKKGADVYVGWDRVTGNPNEATERAFDRMLGENAVTPKDSPPYRPENLFDVFGWLQRNGHDKMDMGADGIATLKYMTDPVENFALLRPTIEHCNVFEPTVRGSKATLEIKGEFGPARDYERVVTVDDTQLVIKSWSPTVIVCDLPLFGAGAWGPVVVKANGHKSNPVPITFWQVRMTYLVDAPGTLFYRWDMVVHFRQDVHKARRKPWEIPKGAVKFFAPMWDSTATMTSGGQGAWGGGSTTFAGGGTPIYGPAAARARFFMGLTTTIDTEAGIVNNFAFVGGSEYTATIVLPEGTITQIHNGAPATNPFSLQLDSDYSIKGGSTSLSTALGTHTLSWITTGGVWTPDDTTQARPGR